MKKYTTIIGVLVLILLLSSCGKSEEKIEPISNEDIQNAKVELLNNNGIQDTQVVQTDERVITISAKNWEFDQPIIRVKQGEQIRIKVNNTDGLHGITIPDMKLIENNEFQLDTSNTGEFIYECANYCGDGHSFMKGKIIIE